MKKLIGLLLVLTMAISLAGCGGGETAVKTDSGSDGSKANASKAITVAVWAVPNSFDTVAKPNTVMTSLVRSVYDYLVRIDKDLNYAPAIAASWKQIDSVTWNFEISDKYVFQNGEPLEMDDIVFSILRFRDEPQTSEIGNAIKDVTYEGQTLTVTLKEPNNSVVPRLLAELFIVNKSYIEEVGEEGLHKAPIGTGPYKVAKYVPGVSCELSTWDGYPFDQPVIEKITMIGVNEKSNIYISAETGQSQLGGDIEALDAERAKENPDLSIIEYNDIGVGFMDFNVTKAPFDDPNVRRAIGYALDRESFCSVIPGSTPAYSMIASAFKNEYYQSKNMPGYDIEKAKEMLAKAGYNESNPLEFDVIIFFPEPALQIYQGMLRSIGVTMNINLVEHGVYLDMRDTLKYQASYTRRVNKTGTALKDISYYGSKGSLNNTGYSNARVDELIGLLLTETDVEKLHKAYIELQDIVAKDMPYVPVMTPCSFWVKNNELKKTVHLYNGIFEFREFDTKG